MLTLPGVLFGQLILTCTVAYLCVDEALNVFEMLLKALAWIVASLEHLPPMESHIWSLHEGGR